MSAFGERKVVISGFNSNDLEQLIGVWAIQGYERQSEVVKEYISFKTAKGRTSHMIYLQILIKKASDDKTNVV